MCGASWPRFDINDDWACHLPRGNSPLIARVAARRASACSPCVTMAFTANLRNFEIPKLGAMAMSTTTRRAPRNRFAQHRKARQKKSFRRRYRLRQCSEMRIARSA